MQKKSILFICSAKPTYSRNEIILEALKKNFEVKAIVSNKNSYILRVPEVLIKFIFTNRNQDYIFVGFLAQPLMPIIRLFSKKPIILDAFISLYDTVCFDREKFSSQSLIGKFLFWLDRKSCLWAHKVITDTNQHIDYFSKTFGVERGKFERIWVGSTANKYTTKQKIKTDKNKFGIIFYGTFLPLHGIEHIIKAADILRNEKDIVFRIIGDGLDFEKNYNLATRLKLKNLTFEKPKPYSELVRIIDSSDICLGIFGNSAKAKRVIPNKVYDALALKKPLVTANTPAIKELLIDRQECILCKPADAKSLADKLISLKNSNEIREKISLNGHDKFARNCSIKAISKRLNVIIKLVSK